MYRYHSTHFGPWVVLVVLLALLVLAFEVWMLVDVAINKKLSDKAKTWWIIGMVLVHPIVAIVYFFTDHQKNR